MFPFSRRFSAVSVFSLYPLLSTFSAFSLSHFFRRFFFLSSNHFALKRGERSVLKGNTWDRKDLFIIGYRQDYWEQAASEICGNWVTGIFRYSRNTPLPFPRHTCRIWSLVPFVSPNCIARASSGRGRLDTKPLNLMFLCVHARSHYGSCPRLYLSATVLIW